MSNPYADTAETYWTAGWAGVLPLPRGKKWPPPTGWTGHGAPYPSYPDVAAWIEDHPGGNVALRLPSGVLGIDVDAYDDKHGQHSLTALEAEYGALPATWTSSSRSDGVSAIRLYRVPEGLNWRGGGTDELANIELVHAGHRYMVVAPSIHPDTGDTYQWRTPRGMVAEGPPKPEELAELPEAWVTALTRPYERAEAAELNNSQANSWHQSLRGGDMCLPVANLLADACGKLQRNDGGARHEIARDTSRALAAYGGEGHSGTAAALDQLGHAFIAAAINPGRGSTTRTEEDARTEYRELLLGAIRLAAGSHPEPAQECDCPTDDELRGLVGDQPAEHQSPGTSRSNTSPELDVSTSARAATWLRHNLGSGLLSGMFRRGGDLVYTPTIGQEGYIPPAEGNLDGPAQVRVVTADILSAQIFYTYRCVRITRTRDGNEIATPTLFPLGAAKQALGALNKMHALRTLRGVTHTPLLRADGTVLDTPGYDPASQLLYLPERGLDVEAVPEHPSELDLKRARKLLDEMVGEFNFVTPADRANYFGMLITPLLRELAPPPYKLGVINAPMPGSGKSLLATVLRVIHGGVFRSETPEDAAEFRKAITSILDTTTGAIVTMDNIGATLRSSVLAGLLTTAQWDDRRLGTSDTVSRDNDRLWTVTGNNIQLGGDLVRRAVWVTIDPGVPNPEQRTGFTIADLEGWARNNRGRILHALLTLARNWVAAGKPTTRLGSDGYADWATTVDGILTTAGIPGGFDAPESVRTPVGADDDEWADFLETVHAVFGTTAWTAKELAAKISASENDLAVADYVAIHPIPIDALPVALAEKVHKAGFSKTLGRWLMNREGRWAGRYAVKRAGAKGRHGVPWRVEGNDTNPESTTESGQNVA